MTLVNLTPHPITIRTADGDITIPPDPRGPARVDVAPGPAGKITVDGMPVDVMAPPVYGPVVDLPDPEDGVGYIVSGLVAGRVDRDDVFAPVTGSKDGVVRDDVSGNVVVTWLIRAR